MVAKKAKPASVEEEGVHAVEVEALTSPEATVSLVTLEKTIDRVSKFLSGVAAVSAIRFRLQTRGWSHEAMDEGRSLLMALLTPAPSAGELRQQATEKQADKRVAEAVRSLDALDEGHFAIAQTALFHNHRAQHDFVFYNLAASTGSKAVLGWRTFLTRIEALRSSPERKETRKEDHAALDLLAKRGLNNAELARIEGLLTIAEPSDTVMGLAEPSVQEEAERLANLLRLRSWYEQWAAVARVVIKRRDHLIRLGFAKRRTSRTSTSKKDNKVGQS